jgi:ketosteroid isomerase-like protein
MNVCGGNWDVTKYRTTLRVTAASILLSLTAPTAAHDPRAPAIAATPAAPAEVIEAGTPTATVIAFHAALTRGDTAEALSLLAEDALIFESGSVERSRAEYGSHHLAADAEFSAAVRRTLVDRSVVHQGDVAWVMTIETVAGTFRGRAINSRSLETMALRRVDGVWRIVHIHWSSANLPVGQ